MMTKQACLIGIDVGTSGVKVLALAENGKIIATDVEEYPLYTPNPGWTEQVPEDWWQGTLKALAKVLPQCSDYEIKGVGLSGQMHGMVALDENDRVIRNAILWNDQRTESQCREITEKAGGLDQLLKYTNNQMLTGYTGGKILWLKQQEPDNYNKVKIVLNPKDYIRFRLTGVKTT